MNVEKAMECVKQESNGEALERGRVCDFGGKSLKTKEQKLSGRLNAIYNWIYDLGFKIGI